MPPDVFFAGAGLDRADHLRLDPGGIAELARRPDARQLQWRGGLPEIGVDGRLRWGPVADPALFLGLDGDTPCFSSIEAAETRAWNAFAGLSLLQEAEAPLFAAALSLSGWHGRHQFCAGCGKPTDSARGGWSRRCGACEAEHFPRIDPVVIMLAEHEDSVLLGRQPQYPPGRYSALAGFVEVGESIEAAVARELAEEAGLAVADVRYICSQPWPFPSSLMIGCIAAAADRTLVIDTTELDDARWFSRDEVAASLSSAPGAQFQPPPRAAIARSLLEHWLTA